MTLSDFALSVAIFSGISTILAAVVGFAVRYALVPFLERRWSHPIGEMLGVVREMKAEIEIMSRAFDGHLDWSQREVDQLWSALERNHPRENRPRPERGDSRTKQGSNPDEKQTRIRP